MRRMVASRSGLAPVEVPDVCRIADGGESLSRCADHFRNQASALRWWPTPQRGRQWRMTAHGALLLSAHEGGQYGVDSSCTRLIEQPLAISRRYLRANLRISPIRSSAAAAAPSPSREPIAMVDAKGAIQAAHACQDGERGHQWTDGTQRSWLAGIGLGPRCVVFVTRQ